MQTERIVTNLKVKNIIILAVVFVIVIVAAVFGYNYLSERYLPDSVPFDNPAAGDIQQEQEQDDAETPDGTENNTSDEYAAPDFTVYDESGNAVKLSDFEGEPVVINFWASWCGPCKSELPAFDKLSAEYGEDVKFMMINLTDGVRETIDGVKEFVEENGYSFEVLYDTDFEAAYAYGVYSIPMTVFVDESGNIYTGYIGAINETTLEEVITELIGE